MLGLSDLLKITNALFGVSLKAYEYSIYLFKTLNYNKFYAAMIDLLMKRISTLTNVLQSDNTDDFLQFMTIIHNKPEILYKPLYPKNKLCELIEKLNEDKMIHIKDILYPKLIINERGGESRTYSNDDLKKNDKAE
jgi:hypothetical protein